VSGGGLVIGGRRLPPAAVAAIRRRNAAVSPPANTALAQLVRAAHAVRVAQAGRGSGGPALPAAHRRRFPAGTATAAEGCPNGCPSER
jgi:hypothetical protein